MSLSASNLQWGGKVRLEDRQFKAWAVLRLIKLAITAKKLNLSMALTNNIDSFVKTDNTLAWDGHTKPFYEVYYLKINEPELNWSLSLRYTLCTSSDFSGGIATLWGIYVDKDGQKLSLKQSFDLQKNEIVHTNQFINIGNSFLSLAEACGSIKEGSQGISWELNFEDPVLSSRSFSNELLYKWRYPPLKFTQPRQLGFASGAVFINGIKKELKRFRIHQGHFFGHSLHKQWAWANCIEFKEDSEAYFDGLSLHAPFGKWYRPTINLFNIGMGGEHYHMNSIPKMLWSNRSHYNSFTWEAICKLRDTKFECHIDRNQEQTAFFEFTGPNNEKRYCYHGLMGNIRIKVFRKSKAGWKFYKLLSSTGKCSFETVLSGLDEDFLTAPIKE